MSLSTSNIYHLNGKFNVTLNDENCIKSEEDNNSNKVQFVYNHAMLQKCYTLSNQENPLKIKPLKIIEIVSREKREEIVQLLKEWNKISEEKATECFVEMYTFPKDSEKYNELKKEKTLFQACQTITSQAYRQLKETNEITVAVDDAEQIQAICLSREDMDNPIAWEIDFLVTAPHNIKGRKNINCSIEGAGTALIEYAIVQSLKHLKLKPESLSNSSMDKIAITLQALSDSRDFYNRIFFKPYKPVSGFNDKILTGKDLFHFLNRYGGRASF